MLRSITDEEKSFITLTPILDIATVKKIEFMQQLLRLKNKHSLEQIAKGLVPGGFLGV
jgi:hypothetical protein